MNLETLMIQYKATVNYLGKEQTYGEGWHCCIDPKDLGMDGEKIHSRYNATPIEAIETAINLYEVIYGAK